LQDAFEILAVVTGFRTIEFSVSYRNRKVTEFIAFTGLGFVNDTIFTFVSHYSCLGIIFPAIG
jgi:hypothetical protein